MTPTIHYQLAMPRPATHMFEIAMQVRGWQADVLDLKMPVWTPGSYLVREYARHLQELTVMSEGRSLDWRKVSKNHWQVQTQGVSEIQVNYRLFANELTVRTNHLDVTHGYVNGAATFLYVPGCDRQPLCLTIHPYKGWRIATTLEPVLGEVHTFQAPDFDTLVDSPLEIGIHRSYKFEVQGKPHELVIWGQGNLEPDMAVSDIAKIVQVEAEMFGGLPYDRYLFLLHLSAQGFGGLEHRNSCSLNYPRLGFRESDKYDRFLELVAHEFFHVWNVKRIRPKELETFDYNGENYTPSLWFCEGATSYYDLLLPLRAGLYTTKGYLQKLSREITRYLNTPGRKVQPLAESSFDAWIKLYRREAHSNNVQISYYLKGAMVSLLLDLYIRNETDNRRSLDDVMRMLWQRFGKPAVNGSQEKSSQEKAGSHGERGYTTEELRQVLETVADRDLGVFLDLALHTTQELPFDAHLEPFGLRLEPEPSQDIVPYLGAVVATDNGREMVKFVEAGSPAHEVGIDPDDELLAIDGLRLGSQQLGDRLKDYRPGDAIQLTLFHQDELRTYTVILMPPRPNTFKLVPVKNPTPRQKRNFKAWLGAELRF